MVNPFDGLSASPWGWDYRDPAVLQEVIVKCPSFSQPGMATQQ